jgi:hypothetical protein
MGLNILVHPASGITYRQHHVRADAEGEMGIAKRLVYLDMGSLNSQLASPRHGVARIDGQVHQNLFDESRISLDRGGASTGVEDKVDVFADESLQQLG